MSTNAWNWPGARWWKCDLHVHTPASYDFDKRETISWLDWVAAAKASGVQILAVTDHNTAAGVDEVRDPSFVVLPGVELTVSPGVHVLAIFDPSMGRDAISALLGKVKIPVTDFGKREACSPVSVVDALREAVEAGAVCIAAHAGSKNGLLTVVNPGQSLRQIVQSPHLAGVEVECWEWEVTDPEDGTKKLPKTWEAEFGKYLDGSLKDYRRPSGQLPLLSSSDAHTLADIGARTSWLKMTTANLEGLRLALQDGPLSVRNQRDALDPNIHANLVLESVTISKARYLGRSAPFELRLNPWLNTVIGGRGTGKSSLVELLRLALRRDVEVPEALRKEWAEMTRVAESHSGRGILTADSEVTVIYRKDGARFRIGWDPAGKATPIESEVAAGQWEPSPGAVAQRFPVRIYSQKQVYELTREPEALLRIVDEAPEVKAGEWREAWSAEETRFLSLRAQAREVAASLGDEPRIVGELEDVKRRLAVFEAAGHAEVLKRWQTRRRQEHGVERWEAGLDGAAAKVHALADAVDLPALDATLFDPTDAGDKELVDAATGIAGKVEAMQADARLLAARADALRAEWTSLRAATGWTASVTAAVAGYDALVEALKAAGGGDPSEYGRLVQQRQVLEARLATFAGKRATHTALVAQSATTLSRLRALRDELTQKRSAFLSATLSANPFVRIEAVPQGAVASIERDLRRLLGREDATFAKDIGSADEPGTLVGTLVGSYLPDFERGDPAKRVKLAADFSARLDATKKRLHDLAAGTVAAQHATFAKHMAGRPPEQMDRLDAWFPADTLLVSFKAQGQGHGFQPITQGSPGQRSAALLAFLLSYGDEPIVLDQPEDDLDNQLVSRLIVEQLRLIKQKRQVLVITHNANIVVNGDAELVVALDVRKGQAVKVCEGGMQEQAVREEICRIMEGGTEAFRERYRRIGGGDDV